MENISNCKITSSNFNFLLKKTTYDYQGKFNNILDELKNNLNNELKTKYWKPESDLHISRNVHDKLTDKLVVLELKCHAKEQYFRRESFEISTISAYVMEVLDAIHTPVNTDLVKDCHRIPSKGSPQKVKTKPQKDSRRVLLSKKKFKATETWLLKLACRCINLHQWEFMSILQTIMDKMQETVGCLANFVILGQ